MERSVRLLLTLLALVTGLSAGPAEARVRANAGSGLEQVEAAEGAFQAVAVRLAAVKAEPAGGGALEAEPGAITVAAAVLVPAIEFGDRALE